MRVRIPGSTANLGPGFDVVGIALDRYLELSDEPFDGAVELPEGAFARIAAREAGHDVAMFSKSEIPVGKGFGSSAAEAVGGALLGRLVAGDDEDAARAAALEVSVALEGHADNAAPSALGGLCLTVGERTHRLVPNLDGLEMVMWLPDSVNETKAARGIIRTELEVMTECTVQAAATAAVVAGFLTGDLNLISECSRDLIHEQARLPFLPATNNVLQGLRSCGFAAWLSGSGPSVACVARESEIDACIAAVGEAGEMVRVNVDLDGAVIL